ncbi:MAG: chromate efflux transporter [Phycisphaerae bacterium]|nr:chromate efflux transporter [Phycisphaerae bacterium]
MSVTPPPPPEARPGSAAGSRSSWSTAAPFFVLGLRAFGGPTAQIEAMRLEFVERRRWIEPERFRRAVGLYQALPGPEATELCVYLGVHRAGRLGGLAAGLAFLLPGVFIVSMLAWAIAAAGDASALRHALAAARPVAVGIVLVAAWRLARDAAADRWLLAILVASFAGALVGTHWFILLAAGAGAAALISRGDGWYGLALLGGVLLAAGLYALMIALRAQAGAAAGEPVDTWVRASTAPTAASLAWTGLKAGAMSFGGAYTALPILRYDLVQVAAAVSPGQFVDALSIVSVAPTPLVTIATVLGWFTGGVAGALVMTVAIFAPALLITLLWHHRLHAVLEHRPLHAVLDGLAAAAVGVMAGAAVDVARAVLWAGSGEGGWHRSELLITAVVVGLLMVWPRRWGGPVLIVIAAFAGAVFGGDPPKWSN